MRLGASIEGVGFWAGGLPSWAAARALVADGTRPAGAQSRPSPQLLAANERRRAPPTVAVALEVALAACDAAGRDPATLPSVFASTHGDLAITDYMCATLAREPQAISPTRFHNSVHNAAAGYWTIGTGSMRAATALSAFDATFAQGLLEALTQLASGEEAVLLVAYDGASVGPLAQVSPSDGLLGGALVLSRGARGSRAHAPTLQVALDDGDGERSGDADARANAARGPLARLAAGNAMAPMLPLFDALAGGAQHVQLDAGAGRVLRVQLQPAREPAHA